MFSRTPRHKQRPTTESNPTSPIDLSFRLWWQTAKRTVKKFGDDRLVDWAAALTYYGTLSLFPGLLVLISVLRLTGRDNTQKILDSLTELAPGPAREILTSAVNELQRGHQSTASIMAVAGFLGALWSASQYIGGFMRASNAIYGVPEGRPAWKTIPLRIGLTLLTGTIVATTALAVILTGRLARFLGALINLGNPVILLWDIAKWPIIVIIINLLITILYRTSPNAYISRFKWVSPGSILAIIMWLIASAGFALYVANFGSYNKIYGSVAAIVIFLVWLWISNLAILLGAQFDAELQRGRAIEAGRVHGEEPYVELRDTRKIDKDPDKNT